MPWTISPGIAPAEPYDGGGLMRLPMDHPAVKDFDDAGLYVNHSDAFRDAIELATGSWYGDILPKDVARYRDSADWSKIPNEADCSEPAALSGHLRQKQTWFGPELSLELTDYR